MRLHKDGGAAERRRATHFASGGVDPFVDSDRDRLSTFALDEVLKRFPEWEVDRENARLGTAPGVRGYESLPVFIP